jgi:xyloglucan 6-xylosyltransferase
MKRRVLIFYVIIIVIFLRLYTTSRMVIEKSKKETVLLITAIPPQPCKSDIGDFVHIQSIKNKLQYSQMKNLSFHFNTVQVDALLDGRWNKLALVHYILESNLNYDWIFWMDVDALIVDMEFDIPLQGYSNYDFVLYGDKDILFNKADFTQGLNSGVFLVRNNEWGRNFIKQACDLGKNGTEKMKSILKNYNGKLRDQNAFGFLLHQEIELRKKVFFERRFAINNYWEDAKTNEQYTPFIIHFTGCEYCDGIYGIKKKECHPYWKKVIQKSAQRFSKGLI